MKISQKNVRVPLFTLTVIGSFLFVILLVIGMAFYQGGTRFNFDEPRFSFTDNYFSELGSVTSFSGESNIISRVFFAVAIVFGGSGLMIFYYNIPFLFRHSNKKIHSISKAASIIGIVSSFACVTIAFVPVDVFTIAHRACVYIFALLVLPTQIILAITILLDTDYPNVFGWFFVAYGTILMAYIMLNAIMQFDNPYYQEVVLIIGQKIIIFLNAVNIGVQAAGSRKQLVIRTQFAEQEVLEKNSSIVEN
ncbi:MAG: hypothetical protein ACTSQK_01155 [Candidatus Heimdallarchaeota archaeon]